MTSTATRRDRPGGLARRPRSPTGWQPRRTSRSRPSRSSARASRRVRRPRIHSSWNVSSRGEEIVDGMRAEKEPRPITGAVEENPARVFAATSRTPTAASCTTWWGSCCSCSSILSMIEPMVCVGDQRRKAETRREEGEEGHQGSLRLRRQRLHHLLSQRHCRSIGAS